MPIVSKPYVVGLEVLRGSKIMKNVSNNKILDVENLSKVFEMKKGFLNPETIRVKAVDNVSFDVEYGEAFGIVGESGCGKSTVARTLLNLIEPSGGKVFFQGDNIIDMSPEAMKELRQKFQIIFQDPYSSLNPRRTIGQTLGEPLHVHKVEKKENIEKVVKNILEEVGLPEEAYYKYPHEFSGGQRQRIAIARALILKPDLIIADESVSALDVSIQSQILLLLNKIKEKHGLSFIFISHDLGVVRYFCQRVAVMYLGRVVEQGTVEDVFDNPKHPYTRLLRGASPVPDPGQKIQLKREIGEMPSPANPPSGCRFHTRCPDVMEVCKHKSPEWIHGENNWKVACHLYNDDEQVLNLS